MHPVGFHRYILHNFTGDTIKGVSEEEVVEFDPPSEVSAKGRFAYVLTL